MTQPSFCTLLQGIHWGWGLLQHDGQEAALKGNTWDRCLDGKMFVTSSYFCFHFPMFYSWSSWLALAACHVFLRWSSLQVQAGSVGRMYVAITVMISQPSLSNGMQRQRKEALGTKDCLLDLNGEICGICSYLTEWCLSFSCIPLELAALPGNHSVTVRQFQPPSQWFKSHSHCPMTFEPCLNVRRRGSITFSGDSI